MFNRKKKEIKPPELDKHRLFNIRLETELGLYVLNGDMITIHLYKDKYGTLEFTYLEDYPVVKGIWFN